MKPEQESFGTSNNNHAKNTKLLKHKAKSFLKTYFEDHNVSYAEYLLNVKEKVVKTISAGICSKSKLNLQAPARQINNLINVSDAVSDESNFMLPTHAAFKQRLKIRQCRFSTTIYDIEGNQEGDSSFYEWYERTPTNDIRLQLSTTEGIKGLIEKGISFHDIFSMDLVKFQEFETLFKSQYILQNNKRKLNDDDDDDDKSNDDDDDDKSNHDDDSDDKSNHDEGGNSGGGGEEEEESKEDDDDDTNYYEYYKHLLQTARFSKSFTFLNYIFSY